MIIKFYLRGNLVLSTELMIKIGCHEKFVVATFRALAFFFFSVEMLTLETSATETL